jgi:uncharacterized protein YndB with AHSA1/START domain
MAVETSDRIEKQIVLNASRARVWKALTDSGEFGQWFGVRFDGPFAPGALLRGVVVPTIADEEIAAYQEAYAGTSFRITVDRIDPERLFSFRWHPYEVAPGSDDSSAPTTLVVFALEDTPDGILLTVTETGFDRVPLDRRVKAFTENEQGWTMQMTLIQKYLARTA